MLVEDGSLVLAGFAVPEHAHTGSLETEFDPADPGEQAANGQHP